MVILSILRNQKKSLNLIFYIFYQNLIVTHVCSFFLNVVHVLNIYNYRYTWYICIYKYI